MKAIKKIVLDTDFILASLEFGIDIFSEIERIVDFNYEICVVDKTLQELKGKANEKLALELIKRMMVIKASDGDIRADDAILRIADNGSIVATQDKGLKEKLKNRKIGVITIRQKRYLVIEK